MSLHLPNLNIVNTSQLGDKSPYNAFPFLLKPDCSVYEKEYKEKDLDLSRVDFVIEFKTNDDPFLDHPSNGGKLESHAKQVNSEPEFDSSEMANPFLCPPSQRRDILGQLTAYATAILGAQFRTHVFMVFIVKEHARLIRWDRSGAVVTKRILFNEQPHLFDFFIRYDIADLEARGRDSTVSLPEPLEIEHAKAIVPELVDAKLFLAVTMRNERYVIRAPGSRPDIPVGRWTRPLLAFDVIGNRRVLLKDSWRVSLPDIEPEGVIYELLRKGKVPNIPRHLSSADVGDDAYHKTRTLDALHYLTPDTYWKLTPHRHYRIVLGTVGRQLNKFKKTKEFANAMYAALKGKV